MAEEQGNSGDLWPPPAPDSPANRRRRPPPERHAHWIDHENRADEPREDAPRLLWWILGAIADLRSRSSVLIRMFLVL